MEFAKIHIRSIVGIVSTSVVVGYLGIVDPVAIGAFFATVVACVMLDKAEWEK